MVNPGAPRAGCDACRIAKKGCTLERPSCARCVRLGKPCTGYRDILRLQVCDETEAICSKFGRRLEPIAPVVDPTRSISTQANACWSPAARSSLEIGIRTPQGDTQQEWVQSIGSFEEYGSGEQVNHRISACFGSYHILTDGPYAFSIDQITTPHILEALGLRKRWGFLCTYKLEATQAPCMDLAARACGAAALRNVTEEETCHRTLTRSHYIAAVAEVNKALGDPLQRLTDQVLIAILLLGYYETLIKDDASPTLTTFRAHITGATELLRLRGHAQFRSTTGRQIFRQLRYQILLLALWTKQDLPNFLHEWSSHCRAASTTADDRIYDPGDDLTDMVCNILSVRTKITLKGICDDIAAEIFSNIDHHMASWASKTLAEYPSWRFQEHRVSVSSPHIWNALIHVYSEGPASLVWNTYRGVRIMVLRLCDKHLRNQAMHDNSSAIVGKLQRHRLVQHQMAKEICAAIPTNLGHTPDGIYRCQSVLLGASSSIWPLFMAGVVLLDRVEKGHLSNSIVSGTDSVARYRTVLSSGCSTISAQEAWIQGRLDFIKDHLGLHWAGAMAEMLRVDRFKIEAWFT